MELSGQDSYAHPPKERYGSYTTADRAELAVQIKAADYNGISFDGRPFSTVPDWLVTALRNELILPNQRRHTDYADWDVQTAEGTVSAMPGDWIIRRENGDLSVVREQDAYILLNLRPPHQGGSEDAERGDDGP